MSITECLHHTGPCVRPRETKGGARTIVLRAHAVGGLRGNQLAWLQARLAPVSVSEKMDGTARKPTEQRLIKQRLDRVGFHGPTRGAQSLRELSAPRAEEQQEEARSWAPRKPGARASTAHLGLQPPPHPFPEPKRLTKSKGPRSQAKQPRRSRPGAQRAGNSGVLGQAATLNSALSQSCCCR